MDAIFIVAIISTFWPAFLDESSNTMFKQSFILLIIYKYMPDLQFQNSINLLYMKTL